MEKLFVLAGKSRSGKDTVASIIKENTNKKTLIYSVTTYLKKYIKDIYGTYDEKNKPRDILQTLGKEIKEKYPNFFLDRMKEDIRFLEEYYDIIVITGIRLVKELDFLKRNFSAVLIKIECDKENNLTEHQKKDITETDVDNYHDYDYVINNKDCEHLKQKIKTIMEEQL